MHVYKYIHAYESALVRNQDGFFTRDNRNVGSQDSAGGAEKRATALPNIIVLIEEMSIM